MAKQDTADTAAEAHELMTVKQAAEYLQVNPKTLYRWLKDRKVPGVRLGDNSWRVSRTELSAWVVRESQANVRRQGPRLTQEWLDSTDRFRKGLLEAMGGVPFKRGEIAEMIDEGRR